MNTEVSHQLGGLVVEADRRCDTDDSVTLDHLAELVLATLRDEGVANGQVDVALVDRIEMTELNETHMGHEGPTDVLSFPMDADEPDVDAGDGPPRHLGDIVICPDVAIAQAPTHAGTVEAEFALLTIHGVLHILGHDHAEPAETAVMQERERVHLRRLGFEHPQPPPEGR